MDNSKNSIDTKSLKKMLKIIPLILIGVVSFLLIAHSVNIPLFSIITIDQTSILLISLLIVLLFIPHITHLKYGDLEVDIDPQEIKELKEEYNKNLNLIIPRKEIQNQKEHPQIFDQISELIDTDHILALAKLRIELEKLLNDLYKWTIQDKKDVDLRRNSPLIQKLRYLREHNIIPGPVSGNIQEVLSICNRAVHGEDIRQKDARIVIEIGFEVLDYLFGLNNEYLGKKVESFSISNEEVENYRNAKYKVTTVIPYVDNPAQNVRVLDQAGLDNFLDAYSEFAEFIVDITKIKDQ